MYTKSLLRWMRCWASMHCSSRSNLLRSTVASTLASTALGAHTSFVCCPYDNLCAHVCQTVGQTVKNAFVRGFGVHDTCVYLSLECRGSMIELHLSNPCIDTFDGWLTNLTCVQFTCTASAAYGESTFHARHTFAGMTMASNDARNDFSFMSIVSTTFPQ